MQDGQHTGLALRRGDDGIGLAQKRDEFDAGRVHDAQSVVRADGVGNDRPAWSDDKAGQPVLARVAGNQDGRAADGGRSKCADVGEMRGVAVGDQVDAGHRPVRVARQETQPSRRIGQGEASHGVLVVRDPRQARAQPGPRGRRVDLACRGRGVACQNARRRRPHKNLVSAPRPRHDFHVRGHAERPAGVEDDAVDQRRGAGAADRPGRQPAVLPRGGKERERPAQIDDLKIIQIRVERRVLGREMSHGLNGHCAAPCLGERSG